MINSILWDMDGVLVETSETHYQSWQAAFEHFKYPFNRGDFMHYYGMNNKSLICGIIPNETTPKLVRAISDYKETWYREHILNQLILLPGVKEWLENFQSRGYSQAVASSGPMANIELIVDKTGIRQYFDALLSCASAPSKPDPWVFLQAASHLKVEPERCLVIEDTSNGIKAALNAGMHCIAVMTSHPSDLLNHADLVLKDLSELTWTNFDHYFNQEK